jgi:AraC-like DNA-binding protein
MRAVVGDHDHAGLTALPSASGGITRLAYARAIAAGADADLLLKKAGLTAQHIEETGLRLNVRDQISFLNLAADALQDDLLGFHLAMAAEPRSIGLIYYVAASSGTLSQALERTARYGSIVNEGVALRYLDGKDARIRFRYIGVSRHLDRHQMEFFVTILVRTCRLLTGLRTVPARVRLTHHRSAMGSELLEFFGDDVEFGAPADELAFAASVREAPVVSADPYLNNLLIRYCEEALLRRSVTASFRSTVENAVAPLLPHGKVRAAEIARRLGVSERTFARQLAAEGTNFSKVLENLRSHLAEHYLDDESLSISQIAWLIGYQEVSAFTHAFKRWTGKSPRAARQ